MSDELAAPPAVADAMFGDRLPLAVRFAEWLAGAGVERGLIGPHEAPRLWDRHLVNCAAVAALIPPESFVVDVGSGAGLPGVVLAIARPDLRILLVESMSRRAAFLDVVVADLGLAGVEVRRARAEELKKPRLQADVVTARAVAPVDRLAALSAPLLRLGGSLLAIKGAGVGREVSSGWQGLRRLAMADRATLHAVVASVTAVQEPERWLAGVEVGTVTRWRPDGSVEEDPFPGLPGSVGSVGSVGSDGAASRASEVDPLALVLRLERGAHGVVRQRQTGLG